MANDDDDRLVDGRRLTLTRSRDLGRQLLEVYDADAYPAIETEQGAWIQAVTELIAAQQEGAGDASDLLEEIVDVIEANDGAIPVTVAGRDVLVCGDEESVCLHRETHSEGDTDVEVVDVDELSAADLADLVADEMEPEELYRALAALNALSDEFDVAEGLFSILDNVNADAEDLLRESVRAGRYSVDEFREILDDIEAADE